jgi:hypothetical protein
MPQEEILKQAGTVTRPVPREPAKHAVIILNDDFTTFDNDRFDIIRANSDMMEEVTAAELALMADVKAVLVDEEWFQIYDNLAQFDEKYVASGMYWNYFYHVWKTVSFSPFSNAIVFVDDGATITAPATFTATIASVIDSEAAKIITLEVADTATLGDRNVVFVQDEDSTEAGIAVHRYGAFIVPDGQTTVTPIAKIGDADYTGSAITVASAAVGATVTFTKQ